MPSTPRPRNGRQPKPVEPTNTANPNLDEARVDANAPGTLTSDQGVQITHTDDSIKVGERGPTLLEDFHFREKITHFDHERIPERVVHARGAGAHGFFQVYDNTLAPYTKARFLTDPSLQTPVFVRFSTVAGSRGSTDTPRDVRGFATKFYTEEGNFDLVGNNMPVFFIQDAIKFPDLIHAVKPEPHREIPQAASAHDTFWDFASLTPESSHMLMWLLSDRALPRNFRMMDGFGVHTFRLINAEGRSTFVKFHWRPVLGTHSMAWEECQQISGKDPDFQRRDLWDNIEQGNFPEWEFAVQLIPEEDEFKYEFDLLDPTKIVPEELVPLQRVGRMVLNRNPDNYFAETEQVAFHIGNIVPGIDFSNDPLLQGRLFSYLDTQLLRLGGPNFTHIPINAPIAKVNTNHRDGFHQHIIHAGKASYFPNSIGGRNPDVAPPEQGYVPYPQHLDAEKVRRRGGSFLDHYSQAAMFYRGQSEAEKQHLIAAAQFELGMCEVMEVRERVVANFNKVDHAMAVEVAKGIGVTPPAEDETTEPAYSAPEVSVENTAHDSIKTRQVAVLLADGFDGDQLNRLTQKLTAEGALAVPIGPTMSPVTDAKGVAVTPLKSLKTGASVLFDAVYVPGGAAAAQTLVANGDALHFVQEAFKHGKPIGATGEGVQLFQAANLGDIQLADGTALGNDRGVVTAGAGGRGGDGGFGDAFVEAMKQHRFFLGRDIASVPA
ncbi:MAG: catalase [Dehalococcoidia bacterium]